MKRASFVAVVLLAAGFVSAAVAQEAAKKAEPVKPAPSPSGAILGQWNEIGRKLIFPKTSMTSKALPAQTPSPSG